MADDQKDFAESAGEVAEEHAVEAAGAGGWEVEELEEDMAAQTSAREGDNVDDEGDDLDVGAQLDAARAQIAELKAQLAARDAEIAALKARGPVGSTAEPTPDIQKLQDRLASLKKEQADADMARDSAWRQLKSVVAEISKLAGPEGKTGAQAPTA